MTVVPELYTAALIFILGLTVGSFLNVCIWRLPREEQVVKGRSRCPKCSRVIRWHENIPLLSFMLLRGKCRGCKASISWTYPLVELTNGLLYGVLFWHFGLTWVSAVYMALASSLIVLSVIDWREMILPDEMTLPGIIAGLALSGLFPELHGGVTLSQGLVWAVYGLLAGGGTLWLAGIVGTWIFKKEAMGGGDIKLMAMVGAFIGPWNALLVNFFLAPVMGAVFGISARIRHKQELIPYGPFLALGTGIAIIWGDRIVAWYLGCIGV